MFDDPLTLAAIEWLREPGGDPCVRDAVRIALESTIDDWWRSQRPARLPRAADARLQRRAEAARQLVESQELDAALALSLAVWPTAEVERLELEAA